MLYFECCCIVIINYSDIPESAKIFSLETVVIVLHHRSMYWLLAKKNANSIQFNILLYLDWELSCLNFTAKDGRNTLRSLLVIDMWSIGPCRLFWLVLHANYYANNCVTFVLNFIVQFLVHVSSLTLIFMCFSGCVMIYQLSYLSFLAWPDGMKSMEYWV